MFEKKVFIKNCLLSISLLVIILSCFGLGVLIGIDYQKNYYEQPTEHWTLIDFIPNDLSIELTAHIYELNLSYSIPLSMSYNNSLLELSVEGYINASVSLIRVSFRTNETLMYFNWGENISFITYSLDAYFNPLIEDDSIIIIRCKIHVTIQFFRRVI